MDKLLEQFCAPFRGVLTDYEKEISYAREIRLRVGQNIRICADNEITVPQFAPDEKQIMTLLLQFCNQALYAREEQLRQGYLTLPQGHRVGVCGHMLMRDQEPIRLNGVQALNIRVARQMPCARRAVEAVWSGGRLRSSLLVSPPGMGKTTMLREIARVVSNAGVQVALADERGELAASVEGVPQLDVGTHTDVMDNMPKAQAMRLLLRAMSPQVIVSDEIGSSEDADALMDAQRCGVKVLCSAHGGSLSDVKSRTAVRMLLADGIFERILVLGGHVGNLLAVYDREGRPC